MAAGPRICWLGTYESDSPRARVLIGGLRAAGAEVLEVHQPVWERTRHKAGAFLRAGSLAAAGGRWLTAWARLAPRLRGLGPVDAVVAGYPAQPDAPPAWLAARALRAPLVVDMLISLADTLGGDRGRVGRAGAAALAGVDRVTLAAADLVIVDTHANASFLTRRFRLPPARVAVVPVGAEPELFPPAPPPDGPAAAVFYGKLSPLHGLETIVAAARLPGTPSIKLIGDGQLAGWLRGELSRDRPPGLEHVPWVEYERLGRELASASIALGVFGASAKAARVVPNKVFQAMAAGRPVVTADTPGIREVVRDGRDGILVPAADPAALAAALRRLAGDAGLRARMGEAAHERYLEIGRPEVVAGAFLDALARRRSTG